METQTDLFLNSKTQYITIEGFNYAYRRVGNASGVPVIGFQHFTGTIDNWDPIIINGLAKDREVILFDNKGVGNSEGETPGTVAEMTQDAVKFIKALGIRQFDILGFSLGGFIAQQLAVTHPELVRKIIIIGAAPQGAKVLYDFAALIEKAQQLSPQELFLFIFFTKTQYSREKGIAALQRLYARSDRDRESGQQAVMAQIKAITAWGTDPVSIDISKVNHPVLIVQGSNDEMMDSANSYELYKQFPNAMLSYYPDAAHGSFFQYPELFVSEAVFFLNGL